MAIQQDESSSLSNIIARYLSRVNEPITLFETVNSVCGMTGSSTNTVRCEITRMIRDNRIIVVSEDAARHKDIMLSREMRQQFRDVPEERIAKPRTVEWAKPHLDKKYIPSTLGARPGSNEYRNWPSLSASRPAS